MNDQTPNGDELPAPTSPHGMVRPPAELDDDEADRLVEAIHESSRDEYYTPGAAAIHWQQAAYWCNMNLPSFTNLTTPMQGMMIGAYMDMYGTDTEWQPEADYEAVLRICDALFKSHGKDGWGYEK